MIHELAIWKLVLGGFVFAAFIFALGFFTAALCCAAGRGEALNAALEEQLRKHLEGGHNAM